MYTDVMLLLAFEMDLPTLLNFCLTSKKVNDKICKDETFWAKKLQKDYSQYLDDFITKPDHYSSYKDELLGKTSREKYILIYHLLNLKEKFNEQIEEPSRKIERVGQLYRKRILTLLGLGLTEIPKEIGYLTNLKELTLSSNKLEKLPKEIGNLRNLNTIHLEHNKLTEIRSELGNLSQLRRLYLIGNPLKTIPKELGYLPDLEWLSLNKNVLIPEIIQRNLKLRIFYPLYKER